jgi:hypothetical protein
MSGASNLAQNGEVTPSQFLAGASYNVSKRVVVDAGAARGLTRAAQDWTAFVGVTVLTARLW